MGRLAALAEAGLTGDDLRAIRSRNRRHEAIALSGNCGQISGAGLTIAKQPSKLGDMYPEAALVDGNAGPHPGHQLVLADDRARLLDERHQDIECSSRKVKRAPVLLNATLRGLQVERAKRKRLPLRPGPRQADEQCPVRGRPLLARHFREFAAGYPMIAGLRTSSSPMRRSSSALASSTSLATPAAPSWSGSK